MTALVLAIEMSQREGSVALGTHGQAARTRRWAGRGQEDVDPLLAEIDRIVRDADAAPHDLAAVAVSVGPGGFTGLRVSVTAAKLIAECVGCALVAVPSPLVAAAATPAGRPGRPRIVALASKRDTAWISAVEGEGPDVRQLGEAGLLGPAGFRSVADGAGELLADEHLSAELLAVARDVGLAVVSPTFSADACLAVGHAMLGRGERADPATLVPTYPREPEAVTLWRERHG